MAPKGQTRAERQGVSLRQKDRDSLFIIIAENRYSYMLFHSENQRSNERV